MTHLQEGKSRSRARAPRREIEELRARLRAAEEELQAIRGGTVDAVLVQAESDQVYTLETPLNAYRLMVAQVPQAAAALAEDGTILACNSRFSDLLHRSPAEILGTSLRTFISPERRAAFDRMLGEGSAREVRGHLVLLPRGAPPKHAYLGLRGLEEGALGLCFIVTDLTEQRHYQELRRTQRAFRESEEVLLAAARMKDEFLATLAHELRNPLAPIGNAVQLLRTCGDLTPETQWATDVIDRQVRLMGRLLEDLLDLSRIALDKSDLRKGVVDLGAVVAAAVESSSPLIEASQQELTLVLPPTPIYLNVDPVRIAQVFGNLLHNAAKFTQQAGHIQLVAEQQGGEVVVTVKDTGIGISQDLLPHVFDIFTQASVSDGRSNGGLGIGLSLVKGLVELHGGSVHARSEGLGKGSEFTVRLPIADAPSLGWERVEPRQTERASRGRRVLVVDDNRDSTDSMAMLLKALGHEVDSAYDAEQAIEMASAQRPDVMLLDIGMPRVDGYEACRRIREQPWGEGICLVALTGWGQDEDRQKSETAGFDHHLVKPVNIEDLKSLISASPRRPGLA